LSISGIIDLSLSHIVRGTGKLSSIFAEVPGLRNRRILVQEDVVLQSKKGSHDSKDKDEAVKANRALEEK
jgi:hypothetical protein